MSRLLTICLACLAASCLLNNDQDTSLQQVYNNFPDSLRKVADIPLPPGYERISTTPHSFATWLQNVRLKKDRRVFLYDGSLKKNQQAQFAVLDISVGQNDLQQCADAVMRLRAEYLFSQHRYDEINFIDNEDHSYRWTGGPDTARFEKYLQKVFGMCGTASLEKQLKSVHELNLMEAGDVFIKGGFPGHAMIVMEVAINAKGNKMYMLAQSYMPAQDIHIVKNPMNDKLSPWYEVNDNGDISTPEWTFTNRQLKRW